MGTRCGVSVSADQSAIIAALVGRTIVAAEIYDAASPGEEWCGHEEVELTLDDGTGVRIVGWGHDAWGVHVVALCRPDEHDWRHNQSLQENRGGPRWPDYCEKCYASRKAPT
jgi:hypothetical protein